ncbi:MAG: hypothetical protein ACI9YH_001366, partial [Colwellia sp.]
KHFFHPKAVYIYESTSSHQTFDSILSPTLSLTSFTPVDSK